MNLCTKTLKVDVITLRLKLETEHRPINTIQRDLTDAHMRIVDALTFKQYNLWRGSSKTLEQITKSKKILALYTHWQTVQKELQAAMNAYKAWLDAVKQDQEMDVSSEMLRPGMATLQLKLIHSAETSWAERWIHKAKQTAKSRSNRQKEERRHNNQGVIRKLN